MTIREAGVKRDGCPWTRRAAETRPVPGGLSWEGYER